ncbi:MAG: BrnT family toxin [Hyphomicrobiales bacterium]|nr:BrnT family toxin [Hyphomicrobiales bacterium]
MHAAARIKTRDSLHASKPDPHPDGSRWQTIGLVGSVLLLVVHTWSEETEGDGPVGRIISARKATAHERKGRGSRARSRRRAFATRPIHPSRESPRPESIRRTHVGLRFSYCPECP